MAGIPLIGVGGVDGWESALEFILAGAKAVGVGSAIAKRDLKIFDEIVRGLKQFLSENGFTSVEELIGYAQKI